MEVGQAKGWKGKGGKGKHKGTPFPMKRKGQDKGKTKRKDTAVDRFDGLCNNCGKYGHRAKPCWNVERSVHEVSGKQTEEIYDHSAVISEVAGIPRGHHRSLVAKEDHHDWVLALHRRETVAAFGREGLCDILLDSGVYVHVCPRYYRS